MPTPTLLVIDALVAPIPGDDPSGGAVPFSTRERLDQARKEVDPADYAEDDPTRPAEARKADWSGIVALAQETMVGVSKDLAVAARLVEAMTKLHGFAGLRDGICVIRRLIEEAWDRVRPPLEEAEDLEVRASVILWLDDADRGARFPGTIRSTPLFVGPSGPISWLNWSLSRSSRPSGLKPEEFEAAVAAAPREACQTVADDLDGVIAELQLLLPAMEARMGAVAPGLTQVRQAALECRTLAHQILDRKGALPSQDAVAEAGAEEGPGDDGDGEPSRGAATATSRAIASRAQAYQRLLEVAEALDKIDPHSPVPFLIRRAITLGQLSFPELMKELIKDASVLSDMGRNLGIEELQE